jgi:MFS family permease
MNNKKAGIGLMLLLALPAAAGDTLTNVYNIYAPIFLQAGNPTFAGGQILTSGFGMGALMVGFWMVADNLLGIFIQPFVGAWSDRLHTRFGRRIPIILFTLPLIILGYFLIPLVPTFIPAELNGQTSQLTNTFIFFTIACVVFYLGFLPARVILQTLRQEAVQPSQRSKVEAWVYFLINIFSILAYTLGAQVYRSYGPLLFWLIGGLYLIACILLIVFYKEDPVPLKAGERVETNSIKQIISVLRSEESGHRHNLIFYLASVLFITLAFGGTSSFSSSWLVNTQGMDEARAATIQAVLLIGSTVAVFPAGHLASGKLGRRVVYILGVAIMVLGGLLVSLLPGQFMIAFFLMGFGAGTFFVTMLPLLFDVAGGKEVSGALVGVLNISYLGGTIFGSLIVGAAIQAVGYLALYPTIILLGSSALICILLTRTSSIPQVVEANP